MSLRKVLNQDEAVRLLRDAEASGLQRADWARRQGVDPRSLNLWRVNLARRGAVPVAPGFVELLPRASAPPAATATARCPAMRRAWMFGCGSSPMIRRRIGCARRV